MPRGNEPLGEIATDVIFENDRVKIWNLIVEPGQSSDWHLHGRDYITCTLEGDHLTLELDGEASQQRQTNVGDWQWHGDHSIHRVVNNSDTRYKNILIELK